MKNRVYSLLLSTALVAAVFTLPACQDDPEIGNTTPKFNYTVPTTYNFSNVNYRNQQIRIIMMSEFVAEARKAHAQGVVVNGDKLKNMLSNLNNPFAADSVNTSGVKLEDKIAGTEIAEFKAMIDSAVAASKNTMPAVNGRSGLIANSADPSKVYLVNSNGLEFKEYFDKTLMGALAHYQISSIYLSEDKIGNTVDNVNVVVGKGTTMEHSWDEAFGYFAVSKEFPTNKTGIAFISKYADGRDALLGVNKKIMDAYLTGRAAISNKDYATRDAQAKIIREQIELVFVATAIHYLNEALKNLANDGVRCHVLSEAIGCIKGLKYNPITKTDFAKINEICGQIGNNFHTVTEAGIKQAKAQLVEIYGLSANADLL